MFYYIYKITNINSGKFYIGSHKTTNLNDDYFGSGIYLKRSITKYGRESFTKEIIIFLQTEQEMFEKETELLQFYKSHKTYNLKFCALGGNTREKYTPKQKQLYIQKLIDNPKSPIGKKGSKSFNYGKSLDVAVRVKQSNSHKNRYKALKKDNIKYTDYIKRQSTISRNNLLKATEKRCCPITVLDSSNNCFYYYKSKKQCMLALGITQNDLNFCINQKQADYIELAKIHQRIIYTTKKKNIIKEKQSNKSSIIFKLHDSLGVMDTYYTKIKDVLLFLNINYDQFKILFNRKIKRSCYSQHFLDIYDRYTITQKQL